MGKWYQMDVETVLKEMQSQPEGLSDAEAKRRLQKVGANVLQEGRKKSVLQIFAEQFQDLLVIILIAAALISMVSGNVESTIVIVAVIILNAILGTVQYRKAQKSLESLKALSSPEAKVLRGRHKIVIPSREVVPGDILILEAGDLTAADGRILNQYSLQVNESSLTGESANVEKVQEVLEGDPVLADRKNMVYSGSLVAYGRGEVLVTETGMDTEMGKIADLMNTTREKKTPLQISLDQFSSRLAVMIAVISVLVFGLSIYRNMPVLDSLMFAVALAVAAIPEALSSIVTIVQAMGTQKMAKEHAIVKELKAVESLGCVSVICSDKTGTLTQNKMSVQQIYIDGKLLRPEELDLKNQLHRYLLYDAILTNDSSVVDGKGIGDPTEYALIEMAQSISLDDDIMRQMMRRMEEIPFDSSRKLMSTKYELYGVPTVLTKGAVDVLLERTVSVRGAEGIVPLTEERKDEILKQNQSFSERGLRVLAFAYRETDEELSLETEKEYIFLGLIAMMDPPRVESKKAVSDAKKAGIRTVMITGDHKITASAIARQIGILEEGDMAVTGMELDQMSDEELDRHVADISVYARVSPENKIRIVDAWQRRGQIVAMTGDGVNDGPALKKADIGVAMGITGTEVSKDAASMILADDNFATIIKAVANGRNVYKNIKNAIKFLLSGNMAGILSVLYTSIAGLPVPFEAVQLLFMNLLTDSLPALAIGMEPAEKDLLSDPPRDPKTGILTGSFMRDLLVQGGLIAVVTMTAYHIGLREDAAMASTMAFITLTLARLFHGFNCRSDKSLISIGFSKNPYSLAAFATGICFLAAVTLAAPLRKLFFVSALTMSQVSMLLLLAILPTVLIQVYRVLKHLRQH